MPKSSLMPDDANYAALLDGLKTRIRSSQLKAAIAVNQELILLYWHIGQEILDRQEGQGWGAKVIDSLSQDLKREFPDVKGFSARNLKYMRAFADAYPNEQIVLQVVAQIPWGHNQILLNKLDTQEQRLWYARETVENGWSRAVLEAQIEAGLYQREGMVVTNFERTLPPAQSELAYAALKDQYSFEFLTIEKDAKLQDLKRALMSHMRDFLLELGVGFSFIGHNYHLSVEGEDFYLDLLFYHLELRCFIVIQLEMGDFRPEQSGLMNFYIRAVDEQKRKDYDQPTIGLILCKTKKKTIAEYALSNLRNPIAVAEHKLPRALQDELPSVEQLQSALDNAVQKLEVVSEAIEVKVQSNEVAMAPEKLTGATLEIQRLLKLLRETNPTASQEEKQAFVTAAMPLTLRQQAASALQSLGKAAVQALLEDAYADTAIALMEGWRDES
ncbi:MAG: PDDEXK nuclease domain-containing protein [Cyanobacteria bacterium J06626_14]